MKHFSISELTSSATALREGIDNRPNKCAYHLLHVLVDQLLDPIREAWGEPIVVSSGYRCKELNTLIGGVKNSHHMLGCAADIIAGNKADHRRLFKLIQQMQQSGQIRFTQLILEDNGRWIHISYVPSDLLSGDWEVMITTRSACNSLRSISFRSSLYEQRDSLSAMPSV